MSRLVFATKGWKRLQKEYREQDVLGMRTQKLHTVLEEDLSGSSVEEAVIHYNALSFFALDCGVAERCSLRIHDADEPGRHGGVHRFWKRHGAVHPAHGQRHSGGGGSQQRGYQKADAQFRREPYEETLLKVEAPRKFPGVFYFFKSWMILLIPKSAEPQSKALVQIGRVSDNR